MKARPPRAVNGVPRSAMRRRASKPEGPRGLGGVCRRRLSHPTYSIGEGGIQRFGPVNDRNEDGKKVKDGVTVKGFFSFAAEKSWRKEVKLEAAPGAPKRMKSTSAVFRPTMTVYQPRQPRERFVPSVPRHPARSRSSGRSRSLRSSRPDTLTHLLESGHEVHACRPTDPGSPWPGIRSRLHQTRRPGLSRFKCALQAGGMEWRNTTVNNLIRGAYHLNEF